MKAFAQLFQVGPNSAAAHMITARMLLHHDVDPGSGQAGKAALELDPQIPEAHFLLGEIAILHAQIDDAVRRIEEEEIDLNPGFAMAHYRLGDAYSRVEKWDQAMAPLERSVWLIRTIAGHSFF